jgi:serine/threonine protein kinase
MQLFPDADLGFIDLAEKILRYSPEKRLTAAEALTHPYFEELRNERVFRNISYFQGL